MDHTWGRESSNRRPNSTQVRVTSDLVNGQKPSKSRRSIPLDSCTPTALHGSRSRCLRIGVTLTGNHSIVRVDCSRSSALAQSADRTDRQSTFSAGRGICSSGGNGGTGDEKALDNPWDGSVAAAVMFSAVPGSAQTTRESTPSHVTIVGCVELEAVTRTRFSSGAA